MGLSSGHSEPDLHPKCVPVNKNLFRVGGIANKIEEKEWNSVQTFAPATTAPGFISSKVHGKV